MEILDFLNAGISVIPILRDSKSPAISSWKEYQKDIPTKSVAQNWTYPIAAIGGKVSGGLVCIDFDNGGSEFGAWMVEVAEIIPEVLEHMVIQETPSGGYHVVYRCPEAEFKNVKLAMFNKTTVLIETRGEGGYFLVAPSAGYTVKEGAFSNLKNISLDNHETIIKISRNFNQYFPEDKKPVTKLSKLGGVSPFDDYDSKENPLPLLEAHGWVQLFDRSGAIYLRRPGKDKGISATWNKIPNKLYVFSTSTEFENEHIYGPAQIYAILEHHADWHMAAKALYDQGYGERGTGDKVKIDEPQKSLVVRVSDIKPEVLRLFRRGLPSGLSSGWNELDRYYRIVKGQLNVVSGIPSHGKSLFMDDLMVNMAFKHKWKWLVYSPENFPIQLHVKYLSDKYLKHRPSADESQRIAFISDHFYFIDIPTDGVKIGQILSECEKNNVDGLCIDPWNELESSKPAAQTETDFIGEWLMRIRRFARKKDIAVWIVAHPQKLRKNRDGKYDVPSLYDIAASAHWYNKADNGLVVWRDFEKNFTELHVQKVKFRHYGNVGTVRFKFDPSSGGFLIDNSYENCREDKMAWAL